MVYPHNAIEKLGFLEIKEYIKEKCLSESARMLVDRIQPLTRRDQIDKFLRQTVEYKTLLVEDDPLIIDHFYALKPMAQKARVEGAFLNEEEFFKLLRTLRTVFSIIEYFEQRLGRYPNLELLFEHLPIEKKLLSLIEVVLDKQGKIKENATPKLGEINKDILKKEQEARKNMESIFREAQSKGYTADGGLTIRSGRLCIPILAENKRKIKGLIHDESATGQTVYLEPNEIFNLNNAIRDLEFERKREIHRILVELTDQLRPYLPIIHKYHGLLTKVDFVRSKALFSLDIDAEMPDLVDSNSISLINARHPLLLLQSLRGTKDKVVPLNIEFGDSYRIILVSGPNAGGKSVCMKTVGLLQIMVQSGLLIPVDRNSKVGVFNHIFADIGDDQSIESDLSTYSAHLTKMKVFVQKANASSLVLIDEFGTGTDPQFGGPIAEAVLDTLNQKNVKGVITTHYSNLKLYASQTDGLENASMLFDSQKLEPLYVLQIGKPGSSYAFEIAEKIGLPNEVLTLAKQKIGVQQQKIETLLVDLEREKKIVYDTKVAVKIQESQLKEERKKAQELQQYFDENRRVLLREAKDEARKVLKDANKLIENTIAEIKSTQADKEKTKLLRKNLHLAISENTTTKKKAFKKTSDKVNSLNQELIVGDWVKLIDSGTEGQIIEVGSNNNLIIALGELRTVVKKNKVEKLRSKEKSRAKKKLGYNNSIAASDFTSEIDVRGMRTDDALNLVETSLDKAVMTGFPTLKIIHGKGNGILRKFIRQYLEKYSHVSHFEDEHADRGGDGITYAYLQ